LLERLEDRTTPSTVMNLNDSGAGSLRQAIFDTPAGGTMNFQTGLSGTIALFSPLAVNNNFTIAGPGSGQLSVADNRAGLQTVFNISANVTISGLGVINSGAGVFNSGTAELDGCALSGNQGGVFNDTNGVISLTGCVLSNDGQGLFNQGQQVILRNCQVVNNTSFYFGGGIENSGHLAVIDPGHRQQHRRRRLRHPAGGDGPAAGHGRPRRGLLPDRDGRGRQRQRGHHLQRQRGAGPGEQHRRGHSGRDHQHERLQRRGRLHRPDAGQGR
jgi:hypothetical protein